jgi:hypothetical protein
VINIFILVFGFFLTSLLFKKLIFNLNLIFVSLIFCSVIGGLLFQNSDFRLAYDLTSERIEIVNEREGSRGLLADGSGSGGLFNAFLYRLRLYELPQVVQDIGLFGRGLGYKTNAAQYRLSEKDLIRARTEEGEESTVLYVFYDYGILFGLLFFLWQIFFSIHLFNISIKNVLRKKNPQGLIFFFAVFLFPLSNLYQPSGLGFIVFTCGLCLVANKVLKY